MGSLAHAVRTAIIDYYDKRGFEMGNSVIHFVRAQSEQRFFAFYLYYDKRGFEMGNSVIHFVRAQSQQWFNTRRVFLAACRDDLVGRVWETLGFPDILEAWP